MFPINSQLLKFILEFLEGADMLTQRAALQPLLRRLRVPPPVLTSDTLHITVNALNNKGRLPGCLNPAHASRGGYTWQHYMLLRPASEATSVTVCYWAPLQHATRTLGLSLPIIPIPGLSNLQARRL